MSKEILVSPGFGAGWATWNTPGKALAEDAELIRLVKAGEHKGKCSLPYRDGSGLNKHDASEAFVRRAMEIMEDGDQPYCGGVSSLEIEEVEGPYAIEEYDGSESVRTAVDFW